MQDAEANVVVTPLRSISHIAHFHHIFLLGERDSSCFMVFMDLLVLMTIFQALRSS